MCGITGWLSAKNLQSSDLAILDKMVKSLMHRGPDDSGTAHFNHAALGHTRLAIIDLACGKQPMYSHDKQYCIVFNGEIYNYRELREQLITHGHHFSTRSDTEVIIELYRREGWEGFSKLRGMFAFTLWDNTHQIALLVRDMSGIKPLFYYISKDGDLLFGSEAKAIIASGVEPRLDEKNLHLLLNFRYIPGTGSLFRDIHQLNPGQVLQWSPFSHETFSQLTLQAVDALDPLAAISDSIKVHCISDVEVGCYLSGGIDSATITKLAQPHLKSPLRTYTLDVGDDPDEAKNAARTASLFHVTNIQQPIEADLQNILPFLIWHLEVPKINSLQVSQLAHLAAKDVKVILSGLGGDELFYGYNVHRIFSRAYQLANILPRNITTVAGSIASSFLTRYQSMPWTELQRVTLILKNLGDWPRVYGLLRNVWDSNILRKQIYGPRMLESDLPDAFDTLSTLWPDDHDPRIAMAKFEWRNKMVNDLLWQEDRVSMAEGLEVRVPFVDTHLYQQIITCCENEIINQSRAKSAMKNIVRNILPSEILERPKSGFQINSPIFFHTHLTPLTEEWLSPEKINKYGLFNPKFVQYIAAQRPAKNLRWHYFILYFMLMTHIWLDTFENNHCPSYNA